LTQEEVSHMKDVKSMISTSNLIFSISLAIFIIILFYFRKSMKNVLRNTSIAVLSFLILSSSLVALSFSWFFLKFHELFFTGNYAFSPTSMLKTLYPDTFFRDIFILYFLLSILGCSVAIAVSYKLKV